MTPADILEKAAEKVRASWCQNVGSRVIGDAFGVCAVISLDRARGTDANGKKINFGAFQDAWEALAQHVGGGVIEWNDTPGRTQDEVVEALLQAAKKLRNVEVST
jgi:hypothetical protein